MPPQASQRMKTQSIAKVSTTSATNAMSSHWQAIIKTTTAKTSISSLSTRPCKQSAAGMLCSNNNKTMPTTDWIATLTLLSASVASAAISRCMCAKRVGFSWFWSARAGVVCVCCWCGCSVAGLWDYWRFHPV